MRKKLHSVTAFDVILAIIMVLICFACVYPMWYICLLYTSPSPRD